MASDVFTGSSRYSSDFSAVIQRATAIWSLPLQQMQQSRAKSNNELTALKTIQDKVVALQTTLQAVGESVQSKAFQTTASDSTVLKVSFASGVAEGSYTLQVGSLGAFSTVVSQSSVTSTGDNFVADQTKLTLRIWSHNEQDENASPTLATEKEIDLTHGTSLQNVVDAIKEQAGEDVQASIVNIGTTSSPKYTLSLQSTKLGMLGIQLSEGAISDSNAPKLMAGDELSREDTSLGRMVQYKVNGATVYSDSRSITIAPNLTADLLKAAPGTDVTVSVKQGTQAFKSAIQNFANAYNDAVAEIDKDTGSSGALVGNSLAKSVSQALRNALFSTVPGNSIGTLAEAGIELSKDGLLSLNQSTFDSAVSKSGFAALKTLVGTTSSDGILKSITDKLGALQTTSTTGTTSGVLADSITSLGASLKAEDERIAAEQERINQRTADIQERMAAADALIAQMEQQVTYITNMFEAMQTSQKAYS
jgi:flagellar hook-associated protein 2